MKKKVKKWIERNYKLLIGIVIGGIISAVGVYAATMISSSNISYDNKSSGLTSTDLKGAIDELYEKSDEIKCGTEEFYVLYSLGDSIHVLTKYPIEGGHASFELVHKSESACLDMENVVEIENPSYAQNKTCGKENFKCSGTGFSSQYKEVLNRIGLSSDIEVIKPSFSELNKAGCNFQLSPVYGNEGSCEALSWLSNVAVTDVIIGPNTTAVVSSNRVDLNRQLCSHYQEDWYEKLIVKIPIKNILM